VAAKALRLDINGMKVYKVDHAEDWRPHMKKEYNPKHFQLEDENGDYFSVDHWPDGMTISKDAIEEEGWKLAPCIWYPPTEYDRKDGKHIKRGAHYSEGRRESTGSMKSMQKENQRLPDHLKEPFINYVYAKHKGLDCTNQRSSLIGAFDQSVIDSSELLQETVVVGFDYINNAWKLGFTIDDEEQLVIIEALNKEIFNHTIVTL
tara:strand:+ start:170 stop:784 length:615 start_codon:yes stop_codon:yes gene_type:complete